MTAQVAVAQDNVAAFYQGKTVSIVVGSPVGGGFDAYARLVSRHLGRFIPGTPAVVVQSVPGAGSNKAASYIALHAPQDGTVIGALQPTAVTQPLIYNNTVPHDPSKFQMLGSLNSSVSFCAVRSDVPVKTFQELFDKEVIIGTSVDGATTRDFPVVLVNVLGVKMKLVAGYGGSREIMMAMERNEVQGICGIDWSSFMTQGRKWLDDGSIRLLVQEDLQGHPAMNKMGIPLITSFAKSDEDRQVFNLFYSHSRFGRPYLVAAGVPAERVAALRKAFSAMQKDEAFLADAGKNQMEIAFMEGEELQELVSQLYRTPPNVVERMKQSLQIKAK